MKKNLVIWILICILSVIVFRQNFDYVFFNFLTIGCIILIFKFFEKNKF
jgi:hypothetical protein